MGIIVEVPIVTCQGVIMADKLREQIAETIWAEGEGSATGWEASWAFIHKSGIPYILADQILNLFKSQGYLSPEEAEEKYTDGKRDGYSFGRADAEQQFKSQVEGLTVIKATEEKPWSSACLRAANEQLQDCQRQLGGMK